MTLTDDLLRPRLASDAAAPLVTYYDDATGERIELSGTTLANWAAKTANLLRDECDLEPGGRVAVLLSAHWQTLAVLLGVWWCGGEVVSDPAGADVVCCEADRLAVASAAGAGVVVALSLHAFGKGLPDLPAGVVDYATEVRLHGDVFTPDGLADTDLAALDGKRASVVLAAARVVGNVEGLATGSRVLTTRDWSVDSGLVHVPLAVLAAGAALVQCRNVDPSALDRRADSERVTHRLI
jgi:uncharacterized protein (TIGR03089 family)